MPDFSTDMSTQQKGYSAVGEFIYFFAGMETDLNNLFRSLLNLRLLEGAIVTSNIDIRTKVHIIKSAINIIPINDSELITSARKDLDSVVKIAEKRNILAIMVSLQLMTELIFSILKPKAKSVFRMRNGRITTLTNTSRK